MIKTTEKMTKQTELNSFRKVVKRKLILNDLTMRDLARELDISPQNLNNRFRGVALDVATIKKQINEAIQLLIEKKKNDE